MSAKIKNPMQLLVNFLFRKPAFFFADPVLRFVVPTAGVMNVVCATCNCEKKKLVCLKVIHFLNNKGLEIRLCLDCPYKKKKCYAFDKRNIKNSNEFKRKKESCRLDMT